MNRWLALASLVCFLTLPIAHAQTPYFRCIHRIVTEREFWTRDTPVMLTKGKNGLELTLGLDSEIPADELMRFLFRDADRRAQITRGLDAFPPIRLLILENLSSFKKGAAVRMMMRPGAQPNAEGAYSPTDLNAGGLARWVNSLRHLSPTERAELKGWTLAQSRNFQRWLENLNPLLEHLTTEAIHNDLPQLYATRDFDDVELQFRDRLYETSPRRFRDLADNLTRVFPGAQTHWHLGIPASVPKYKVVAIARVLETLTTLRRAANPSSQALARVATTLFSDISFTALNGERIIIRLTWNRWGPQGERHDLEIRQSTDPDEGRSLIFLATSLVLAEKVIEPTLIPSEGWIDPATGPLRDALRYASQVLSKSADPAHRQVAQELMAFVTELPEKSPKSGGLELSQAFRNRLAEYLDLHRVWDLLDPEVFIDSSAPKTR